MTSMTQVVIDGRLFQIDISCRTPTDWYVSEYSQGILIDHLESRAAAQTAMAEWIKAHKESK